VILDGDAAVIQLWEDHLQPRLQSYIEQAPGLRERVPDIDTVDLRFDERIYVRPAGKKPRQVDARPRTAPPPRGSTGGAKPRTR
jgi:hypothetical protein